MMNFTLEDTVLDFDINFLHPSNNVVNECRTDKQRKAIGIAKRKIIATDSLIRKYYTNKEKLEQTEVVLLSAKEECKQVCLDYKNALEKCTQLEKDFHILKIRNKELDEKYNFTQNQYEAMKSHAHQLQSLVRGHESVIEALKIEKVLVNNNSEDYEKDLSAIQQENKLLLKHLSCIKDIALGKKKLRPRHKIILEKYESSKNVSSDDDSASEGNFEEPDFLDDNPHSPLFAALPQDSGADKTENTISKPNKTEINVKKDLSRFNEENDSDNEVVSEDTGRGSSLAFSDGEKCFNSPDYYNADSPITPEPEKIKEKVTRIDLRTKPNRNCEVIDVATSPIIFDDEHLLSDNNLLFCDETVTNNLEYFITDIPLSNEIVTIKEKRKVADVGTSPIRDIEGVDIATSPLIFDKSDVVSTDNVIDTILLTDIETDVINSNKLSDIDGSITCQKSPFKLIDDIVTGVVGKHTTITNLASYCELEISGKSIEERKCLERNKSNNLCSEDSNDSEIEMILNTMRLTQQLITPIPKTPVKASEIKNAQETIKEVSDFSSKHTVCQDALKLYQQHEKSLDDIKKDIKNIKYFLNNRLLLNHKSIEHIPKKIDNCRSSVLFDDTSQETILIYANDQNSSGRVEENALTTFDLSIALRKEGLPTSIIEQDEVEITYNNNIQNDVLPRPKIVEQKIISSSSPLQNTIDESIEISKDIGCESKSIKNIEHINDKPVNDSREAITFEDDCINEYENDNVVNDKVNHTVNGLLKDFNENKITKSKRLSKLNKFKQKLLPKSKISSVKVPIKKLRSKLRPVPVTKKISRIDATAILNNKSVYENAAKIMAEIKSKEKNLVKKSFVTKKAKKLALHGKDETLPILQEKNNLIPNQISFDVNNINNLNNPVVCLSQLKLDIPQGQLLEPVNVVIPQDGCSSVTTKSCESNKQNNNNFISPLQQDTKDKSPENIEQKRKKLKRAATDSPDVVCKRILRSSSNRETYIDLDNPREAVSSVNENFIVDTRNKTRSCKLLSDKNDQMTHYIQTDRCTLNEIRKRKFDNVKNEKQNRYRAESNSTTQIPDYEMSMVDVAKQNRIRNINERNSEIEINGDETSVVALSNSNRHPKQSILCKMLEKHGRTGKTSAKKVPENTSNSISKKLEEKIAIINDLPAGKANPTMNKLVEEIKGWSDKNFLSGFMKYLKDPTRKTELFNKVNSPPAPPMSKSEQVLLYIVRQMQIREPNTVNVILTHIEFSLFQINRSPEFDVIESLSHFYALLCRYFGLKSRLRLFILDAMYCLQFKVVPLIKQCLDVWMHILPLAHMGIAKSPLVTCLVYLLHFYKCEDRFNRVQEIRNILNRKYFYQITDWNETKILELFKNAIKELRDIPIEKKMLKMALIILGKRHGPTWCHKNIIKNMLMPAIESENISAPIKQFCIQMLGALLKPFPADMKIHFEIAVNHLHDMLDHNPSDKMKEAIFTSLIYINGHNPNRVIQSLLTWIPEQVSPEFEQLLRDYVRGKPLFAWKKILSRITM